MMFVIHFIRFATLLGAISTLATATPVPQRPSELVARGILCKLPIVNILCRKDVGEVNVLTPVGMASGLQSSSSSSRYVFHFGRLLVKLI